MSNEPESLALLQLFDKVFNIRRPLLSIYKKKSKNHFGFGIEEKWMVIWMRIYLYGNTPKKSENEFLGMVQ